MWPLTKAEPPRDVGYYVRLAHKLATRLGLERGRRRDYQLENDILAARITELHEELRVLRAANRELNAAAVKDAKYARTPVRRLDEERESPADIGVRW